MARYRNHRVVITPPPKPPPAALPPATPPVNVLESAIKLVGVAVLVVGVITLAAPRLRHVERPLPAPGVTCLSIERERSTGREHERRCSVDEGWHAWRSPRGEVVVVPDDAEPLRRR